MNADLFPSVAGGIDIFASFIQICLCWFQFEYNDYASVCRYVINIIHFYHHTSLTRSHFPKYHSTMLQYLLMETEVSFENGQ